MALYTICFDWLIDVTSDKDVVIVFLPQFVCLSVSEITQKAMDILMKFTKGFVALGYETINNILGVIWVQNFPPI